MNVRLVRLLATVKDANGQLISSLNKNDFTVYDNGVPQEISVFERQTEQPLSVAVLVDSSASTGIEHALRAGFRQQVLQSAVVREGIRGIRAALYSFNWEVTLMSSYTRRFARLDTSLKRLHSEGGTSMYDAIFLASRDMELRDGRHVMVIVTDGGDTTSMKNYHQALSPRKWPTW